jgi:hypothetical protein
LRNSYLWGHNSASLSLSLSMDLISSRSAISKTLYRLCSEVAKSCKTFLRSQYYQHSI